MYAFVVTYPGEPCMHICVGDKHIHFTKSLAGQSKITPYIAQKLSQMTVIMLCLIQSSF